MKACVMPAPAPWAKTKQARAFAGEIRSAEMPAAFAIPISSSCALVIFFRPVPTMNALEALTRTSRAGKAGPLTR